jgi:hypothetical protein
MKPKRQEQNVKKPKLKARRASAEAGFIKKTRARNRLNARSVATLKKFGRHADGGNLYLSISPNGGRRWVFLYRRHGKQTELGFGSARDVTLARARELARQARSKLAEGGQSKGHQSEMAGRPAAIADTGPPR